MKKIILASSSPYRKTLLARLGIPFEVQSPDIDETPKPNETPLALCQRLAVEKAQAIRDQYDNALIISSDQVALLGGECVGKPLNHQNAVKQLMLASGNLMTHYTSLCVLDTQSGNYETDVDTTTVHFRDLSVEEIEYYLSIEQPYNCCGSVKSEGLGIALIKKIDNEDPTALIGLPLIKLTELLTRLGTPLLSS